MHMSYLRLSILKQLAPRHSDSNLHKYINNAKNIICIAHHIAKFTTKLNDIRYCTLASSDIARVLWIIFRESFNVIESPLFTRRNWTRLLFFYFLLTIAIKIRRLCNYPRFLVISIIESYRTASLRRLYRVSRIFFFCLEDIYGWITVWLWNYLYMLLIG